MGTLFLTKEARIYNGAKIASSISGAGKTRQLHVQNETITFSNTIHKNKLKVDVPTGMWVYLWAVYFVPLV